MTPDHADAAPGDAQPRRLAPEQVGFPVTPVRPPLADRGLSRLGAIVALVIGVAVLKPWGAAGDAPTPGPPRAIGTVAPATPRPIDESAEGLAGPICLGASGWRIASLERWRSQDVRVWRAIEPIATASGPLDQEIPTAPLFGLEVRALGWCAPAYGPERPAGPMLIDGWMVIDGVAHELTLRQVLPERGTTPLAGLYVPVAACALGATCAPTQTRSVTQRWETGRVVFRYTDQGASSALWFGADVELYVVPEPSAEATKPPLR